MADNQNPVASDQNETAPQGTATQTVNDAPANGDSNVPEGYELMRLEDKNALIAARDRAHQAAMEADGESEFLLTLAKERGAQSFLKENPKDYPDVNPDDLMHVESPEDFEPEAKRLQEKINNAVAKKLQGVEIADQRPQLTESERSERVEALRNANKAGSFGQMLDLRLNNR